MGKPDFQLNLRKMIGIHQGRERMDVLLTVILPLFLMLVSSYTNAWAFTGGHMVLSGPDLANTIVAICKGLFVEALVFCFFKLFKILVGLGKWNLLAAVVPLIVGLFAVILSSGCGVAWAAQSGEMTFLIASVSSFISPSVASVFKVSVGVLFPVSLAVLAIYDPKHMIKEHIESGADLSVLALMVENAEHYQGQLRQAQRAAHDDPQMQQLITQMGRDNAQQAVNAAKSGDLSFGIRKSTEQLQGSGSQPSVKRIHPPAGGPAFAPPGLAGPGQNSMFPPMSPFAPQQQQPFINGQVSTGPFPPTGTTTQLNYPQQAPAPVQQKNPLGQALGWLSGNVKS